MIADGTAKMGEGREMREEKRKKEKRKKVGNGREVGERKM